jgi:molybdate transport system substrate-binding protein
MRRVLVFVLSTLVFGACGSGDGGGDPTTSTSRTAGSKLEGTVTVYAAQSLSSAFNDLGEAFEYEHPGVKVSFNFAGSSTLVTQITQGAPADVFASADQSNMDELVSAGSVDGTPRVFTKNRLQLVVAKGNPKGVTGLADLGRSGVATVLCAENVPCGAYAQEALGKAGVHVTPKSEESSVAGVIGRVQSGEADAGIVYVTDVQANAAVSGVDIPDEDNVVAEYPHAQLKDATNPAGAKAFLAFVESAEGQAILGRFGFLPR